MGEIEKQLEEMNERLLSLETSHREEYTITAIEPVFAASPHHAVRKFLDEIKTTLTDPEICPEPLDERTLDTVLDVIENTQLTAEPLNGRGV